MLYGLIHTTHLEIDDIAIIYWYLIILGREESRPYLYIGLAITILWGSSYHNIIGKEISTILLSAEETSRERTAIVA